MDKHEYKTLNSAEQAEVFFKAPVKERAELLFYSNEPKKLSRSLSPEQFYLITKEFSAEERGELVCYTTLPQLLFLSDIDCWDRDQINTRSFLSWLEMLANADEDLLLTWLSEIDYEMVVSGFKKLIHILKPDLEYPTDELLKNQPYFTIDGYYYIFAGEENLETVRRSLQLLYENKRGRYAAVLEGVLGELDVELEEEAYQMRQARLSQRGFPDTETAREIYRPLTLEEFENFPRKEPPQAKKGSEIYAATSPNALMIRSKEHLFLDDVLQVFREDPPEVLEGLHEEFVWMANKIIACEGIRFTSEDYVRKGLERVRQIVSVGLEHLSGADVQEARTLMRERWLEVILRWGLTQIMALKDEASRFMHRYWKAMREPCLHFVGDPYDKILKGVTQSLPQFYDLGLAATEGEFRDFRNLEEIENTRMAIGEISGIHDYLSNLFPEIFKGINMPMRKHRDGEITLFRLLGTLYARFTLNRKLSDRPLEQRELVAFIKKAFVKDEDPRSLIAAETEGFLKSSIPHEQRRVLDPLWGRVFQNLEFDLGQLNPDRSVDMRFISSVLIRQGASKNREQIHR